MYSASRLASRRLAISTTLEGLGGNAQESSLSIYLTSSSSFRSVSFRELGLVLRYAGQLARRLRSVNAGML